VRLGRAAPSLDARLEALTEAVELARGRLPGEDVAAAAAVLERAGRRLGLGLETTVVALGGPTGAGKSTLFNALAGADLVAASRRRPTTSKATAAVWGDVQQALLDWLDVPLRHAIGGDLGTFAAPRGRDSGDAGLVILDLPDFDSVEAAHRVEVDRLVPVVDLLVWVVDPQKYADASLHERYLRPLAPHAGSMLAVLNQADTLAAPDRERARQDLGRLLQGEGLDGVPVLAVSAATGDGIDALRDAVRERVARREAATARLATDVGLAARRLATGCDGRAPGVSDAGRAALNAALGEAAGVPRVVAAVGSAHRRRGALATGWPVARWLRRFRPDPLKRLHLTGAGEAASGGTGRREGAGDDVSTVARTSLPAATPVQRAGVASACRALAAGASDGLPDPWPRIVRSAATAQEERLPDRLDEAVGGADLRVTRPRWWAVANAAQRVLALAALAGLVWLVALAALGWLRLDDVIPTPDVLEIPVPTLLLGGGVLLGLLLAALAGVLNRSGARRRGRRAEKALHARIGTVADEAVVGPVTAALDARERLCAAAEAAAHA
jgi:energy-coupling factor transporter ATP-binding protein EcfA2